ncbi:DUF1961 family protein [Catalinimonas sp. 4WD22]|uniref:DUF1961 family protein n=1 Tax=Catalinimonas locisalis TaxID=3133978 RepID=UPI003100D210
MKYHLPGICLICFIICMISGCNQKNRPKASWTKSELLFEYSGTTDWKSEWMLDGLRSKVVNNEEGMELIAGAEHGNDTCHTVLWTKQSFQGDICIEYDYTRTDTITRCVNILYFHATGKGNAEYPSDISLWNDKRVVPHMRTYFNHMNAYHISYAAFSATEYSGDNDYIRLRRYNPNTEGLAETDVPGDHFSTGLFQPNVSYHIEVVKYGDQIEMHITNKADTSETLVCKWDVSMYPSNESGRIGLRHMYTRNARYKNFKVWRVK